MQDKNTKLRQSLAKVIKSRRKCSITQLCREIGISKSIWSGIEKGNKELLFSTLWKIAEAIDLKPHVLVKLVEEDLGESFSFLYD